MKNIKYIHPTINTIPITPNRLLAGSEAGITKDKNIETNAPLTGVEQVIRMPNRKSLGSGKRK